MADKTDSGGQPTLEKLEREGVSARKCISYQGLGEYGGNGGSKPAGNAPRTAKQVPALSSYGPMRRGSGGY